MQDKGENIRKWLRKRLPAHQLRLGALGLIILAAFIIAISSYVSLLTKSDSKKSNASKTSASSKARHATSSRSATPAQAAPTTPVSALAGATAYPSSILDLSAWKLTLPIPGDDGSSPEEITQPKLGSFALAPYFQVNDQKNGVQFQAQVSGVTTSGSNYPRSELREMTADGSKEASWSDTSGSNVMTLREAITHLPAQKSEVVAGQIHGPSDYVILVRLENSNLFIEADGKSVGTLDSNYQLGTAFNLQISATNGHIVVSYNGVQKVDYAVSGSGYYFKAGCYTQSNSKYDSNPDDYGQVVIYSLQVNHA